MVPFQHFELPLFPQMYPGPCSLASGSSHTDVPSAISFWPCLTPSATHLWVSAWTSLLLGYLFWLLYLAMCSYGFWDLQCQNTHHASFLIPCVCLSLWPASREDRRHVGPFNMVPPFQGQDVADSRRSNKYLSVNSFKTSPVFMNVNFAHTVFRT